MNGTAIQYISLMHYNRVCNKEGVNDAFNENSLCRHQDSNPQPSDPLLICCSRTFTNGLGLLLFARFCHQACLRSRPLLAFIGLCNYETWKMTQPIIKQNYNRLLLQENFSPKCPSLISKEKFEFLFRSILLCFKKSLSKFKIKSFSIKQEKLFRQTRFSAATSLSAAAAVAAATAATVATATAAVVGQNRLECAFNNHMVLSV